MVVEFRPQRRDKSRSVVLEGIERLVPRGLLEGELAAWLAAPVAGGPLHRRILEPLVRMRPEYVFLVDGPVARELASCCEARMGFGLELGLLSPNEELDPRWVRIPGHGLLDLDADLGVQSVAALRSRFEPGVEGMAGLEEFGLERTMILEKPRALVRMAHNGRHLRSLCVDALTGEFGPYPSMGKRVPWGLLGHRARVARRVRVEGPVAVGEDSYVAPGASLGPGAILGRGCYVGPGSHVENATLLDGARVERGEWVTSVVRTPLRDLL